MSHCAFFQICVKSSRCIEGINAEVNSDGSDDLTSLENRLDVKNREIEESTRAAALVVRGC